MGQKVKFNFYVSRRLHALTYKRMLSGAIVIMPVMWQAIVGVRIGACTVLGLRLIRHVFRLGVSPGRVDIPISEGDRLTSDPIKRVVLIRVAGTDPEITSWKIEIVGKSYTDHEIKSF